MGFTITYKTSTTKDGLYAYALHAEAIVSDEDSTESGDPEIFVFRRSTPTMDPFGPIDRKVDDEFFNVATPVDMYDIPVKEPDIEHGMPYFRESKLDLWFRNKEDLERAKKAIDEDVASLAKLLHDVTDVDSFEATETVTHNTHSTHK